MNHNHNHDNARRIGPQLVPVRFEFNDPTATTACVAGTFNRWQPEAKTPHSSGAGNWWKEMALEPGGYEHCLVVDSRWMPIPLARETVPNPFGGRNSILNVASSPETAQPGDTESLPAENDRLSDTNVGDHLVAEGNLPFTSANRQKDEQRVGTSQGRLCQKS